MKAAYSTIRFPGTIVNPVHPNKNANAGMQGTAISDKFALTNKQDDNGREA